MERGSSSKQVKPAEIAEGQKEEKSYTEVAKVQKNENNVHDNYCFPRVLPPGYRFCPRDDELVKSYLMKKVRNETLPPNIISDVNLYKYSPYDLARNFQPWSEHEWYFFTPRDRKHPNGKWPNRAAGGGFWKATGRDKKIKEGDDVIGARKSLDFYNGKPKHGMKTDWKMHEFRIDGLPENTRTRTEANKRLDDCVLCRIYKNKRKENSEKVTDEKENSVDDHPSAWQPALQVFIGDAPAHSGLVNLPPSPPKLMDSVNLPVSNHPDIFPQPNYSQFWSEDNRELMSRGDLGNLDFIDQSSSQPETMTSLIDEYHFAVEIYDGQSQYGFIDTNQGSVNKFAAGILFTADSDMASLWNNDSPVTFNSQLPPADALILNPSPVSQRPIGYIDENNDMSVFMDGSSGMEQDGRG